MRRLSLAPFAPRLVPILALAAGLSGCIPATPRPEAPRPVHPAPAPTTPPPRPVLTQDWRDWPLTPGDWRYLRDAQGTHATFGQPGAPSLILSCDLRARQIHIGRPGAVPGSLTIRTSSTVRALPSRASATGATVTLAAADPLLDAMAFSRGRFTMEQAGQTTLVIPAYAEIGRVIEDCRG
ncbi:hypothetical protein RN629_03575 [Sphingomonadaceae bacterium jetA1]|jgi:hypothetical protein|uniref:hypothetical protein n=1 Tax=Facivitalis istanbulensis TaxID=3075838 RepID=UPI003477048C